MVDFSVQTTNVQEPNLSSARFERPPVQDNSAAMRTSVTTGVIGELGKQGIEAYKGFRVGELNTATQQTIQDYMDSRNNPEVAKSALTEVASTDIQNSIFKPQGEQLSAVEQAQRSRLNTYRQALQQGVMTSGEFEDRVMSNLREAVNKTPGLFQEFKAEANRVLELSGISGVMKSDELLAQSKQKQAEKALVDIQDRAKKEHIYYDTTDSYWNIATKVQAAEQDTRAYDMQVRNKERLAMANVEQARSWVESAGDNFLRGSIGNANKVLMDMVDQQGINADTYPKFKAQIDATLENSHMLFVDAIPVSIRQDANVQDLIKSHAASTEQLKKRLENLSTGEDIKKVINNEVDILKASQDKQLRKIVNVPALELSAKLASSVPGVVTGSAANRESLVNVYSAIASGNFQSPALGAIVPKSDKDKTSAAVIEGSLTYAKTAKDYTAFNSTINAMNTQAPLIDNIKTKQQFLFNNLSTIARQEPMKLDSDTIHKVDTHIGLMMNDPKFGVGTLVDTSKGKNVSMDVLPSGQLIFTGSDAAKFNQAYANNINVALQAFANTHNMPMKEAAKSFYPQYLGPVINAIRDTKPPVQSVAGTIRRP